MTVKEILKLAIIFLGYDEVLDTNIFDGETQPSEDNEKLISVLERCLNLTIEEIATDYIPIIKTKEVIFKNGKVALNEINENLMEVISVKRNGNVEFYEDNEFLYANIDRADVIFRKYPEKLKITDDCDEFLRKLPARVIAYGVAMEYSFITTLSDEATIWEKRYKDGLLVLSRKNSERKLPRWRW